MLMLSCIVSFGNCPQSTQVLSIIICLKNLSQTVHTLHHWSWCKVFTMLGCWAMHCWCDCYVHCKPLGQTCMLSAVTVMCISFIQVHNYKLHNKSGTVLYSCCLFVDSDVAAIWPGLEWQQQTQVHGPVYVCAWWCHWESWPLGEFAAFSGWLVCWHSSCVLGESQNWTSRMLCCQACVVKESILCTLLCSDCWCTLQTLSSRAWMFVNKTLMVSIILCFKKASFFAA